MQLTEEFFRQAVRICTELAESRGIDGALALVEQDPDTSCILVRSVLIRRNSPVVGDAWDGINVQNVAICKATAALQSGKPTGMTGKGSQFPAYHPPWAGGIPPALSETFPKIGWGFSGATEAEDVQLVRDTRAMLGG